MDKEHRKKIQATKLIITEVFMLIVIVLTVVILTFIVMGYRLTDDGKLEQSGLVEVESIPTGATVTIDQEVLPAKTNTSKILPEGEYTILLEKEGYTSWSKTFNTHPGFLTKLAYPRLYKLDRKAETIEKLSSAPTFFATSPDRDLIFYATGSQLYSLNIESDSAEPIALDLTKLFGATLPADLKIHTWSKSGERLIVTFTKDDTKHFAVIDLALPSASLDLSTTFDLTISDLRFISAGGENVFILENGHLRTASLSSEQLSSVLVDRVESFENSGLNAIVVQTTKEISLYNYSSKSLVSLKKSTAETVRALISEYLGRSTLVFLEDNQATVYRGELPSENITKENPLPTPVGEYTLNFTPSTFRMAAKNQIILASEDANYTIFNLETYSTSSYTLESNLTFWPDEYTIGNTFNEELIFRDFDGDNRQVLGRAANGFPAVITKNNKYLYYVATDYSITRENIK